MRVLGEDEARLFYPIVVLVIYHYNYIIDEGYFVDIESFLKEMSPFGWYAGHVAPVEVREKPRSGVGEVLRLVNARSE